jgi:hypothetical protein
MKNNQSVYFIKGAKYRKWPKRALCREEKVEISNLLIERHGVSVDVAQVLVAERIMVRR